MSRLPRIFFDLFALKFAVHLLRENFQRPAHVERTYKEEEALEDKFQEQILRPVLPGELSRGRQNVAGSASRNRSN